MIDTQTLILFAAAVLALLVSPGPNMAFLLSHGISHGARGGLAVAFGIFVADLLLTALTATGITAMITAWPPSFDVIRYFGALYLLWLAIQTIRQHGSPHLVEKRSASTWSIFRMAMLNSLLNPKALLFFMVFLPQFVAPARGNLPLQLAMLGVVLSLIALVFHCALGLASGKVGRLFQRSASAARYFAWFHASIFVGLAARLLLLERPTTR
ncbi:LysE family translocator [Pseudomonas benzenivorans]|uniref:LysE family translocator n=1 Tax=Pseudomonas benzenivorans TaxID=556533 RepID=A0ABY5HDW2_9PSED|nr:LysE family translocator [Pseudomonas benzenivorans]UTW09186.1 LysE family translocator [Pseudomonas benzenivorans]